MHDLKFIRDHPERFDAGLASRGLAPMSGEVLRLDAQRRAFITELQELQKARNDASKQIGAAKAKGDDEHSGRCDCQQKGRAGCF